MALRHRTSLLFPTQQGLSLSIVVQKTFDIDFYRNDIAPFKGEVEVWFEKKYGLSIYFALIALTIWIVIVPKSKLIWRVFKSLPPPPKILHQALGIES